MPGGLGDRRGRGRAVGRRVPHAQGELAGGDVHRPAPQARGRAAGTKRGFTATRRAASNRLARQVGGEAEGGEERLGVEEEVDPGDPAA